MERELNEKILDILSKYQYPINHLLYANKVDLYHVHSIADYSKEQIYQSIWYLLSKGLININLTVPIQSLEELLKINFDLYATIGLTDLGGQEWENVFKPNWLNYIDVLYDDLSYTEPVSIELQSLNKTLLLNILEFLNIDVDEYFSIDMNWSPCYWKNFSNTESIKFQYIANDINTKIIIDEIYDSISDYQDIFCCKTEHLF